MGELGSLAVYFNWFDFSPLCVSKCLLNMGFKIGVLGDERAGRALRLKTASFPRSFSTRLLTHKFTAKKINVRRLISLDYAKVWSQHKCV